MENSRSTTRGKSLYIVCLALSIMIVLAFLQVIVQQLNFVVRSLSSSPLYDHDSDSMTGGKKLGNIAASNVGSVKELWQPFFANPVDWWDNRKNKKNPKYPDFKHKDTGEALWVEGRYNPP
ncbi:protein OSB1, mitochondrial-like [Carya illinoinensis]|uniref:protein OSB1, mitochondrial-like n=1 Tax=Carya illinoinensis TaxID=32201 RepID=UPI001C721D52|nr:protein OSB1, mitochondrial-like [Carya illinoinensis]